MKNFFTWFMAFPSIACIILLSCYRFQLAGQAEWITLITAWIGSTATIMLGVIVFYQTENHKKRQEEDNALYQEQAEKNRQQDLIIKANPIVYLNGISRFDFNTAGIVGVSKESKHNSLMENEPFEKYANFKNYFSFDLVFKNDLGRMIDFITVKAATLSCTKGEFTDDNYEHHFSKTLFNYSKKPAIVKLGQPGEYVALLQLFLNDVDGDDIVFWLNDETLQWVLTFEYTLSNCCGVAVDFESQIVFNIKPNPQKTILTLTCEPDVKQIVTWQRSEITIVEHEDNTND